MVDPKSMSGHCNCISPINFEAEAVYVLRLSPLSNKYCSQMPGFTWSRCQFYLTEHVLPEKYTKNKFLQNIWFSFAVRQKNSSEHDKKTD